MLIATPAKAVAISRPEVTFTALLMAVTVAVRPIAIQVIGVVSRDVVNTIDSNEEVWLYSEKQE